MSHLRRAALPAAALLLWPALATRAQEQVEPELPAFVPSPPPVPDRARLGAARSADLAPGAWACNVLTLVDEIDCVFTTVVPPATHEEGAGTNAALAGRVGRALCDRVARETADVRLAAKVRARCLERLADVEPLCAGGVSRLVDDGDHFGAEHALCYSAMLALVREVRAIGQTWAPCCACLVDAGCAASFSACADDVARCHAPRMTTTPRCEPMRCEATCGATALLASDTTDEKPRGSR